MNTNLPNSVSGRSEIKISRKEENSPFSPDIETWKAFKSGSNSAFILIYERFFDSLYSYGLRINNNEELVKDAIHDVFLDLKKNSNSIGETDSIKFYLFKCLKRRIYKELKGWTNLKEELILQDCFEITFSHEQTLIDRQINIEMSQNVNSAISKLSPRKREAIYYVYFEGMSYQQVSELMELSDSKSARDLIYKALKCLRDSLGFLPVFFIAFSP
ncbi:sigma-70 family RNA polymerase sigma factor [Algoriphagus sp. C2-6-M1]|uniref:RNA polymerase sigma factor n=1 Tax=Algoriphagus persicinus TaxID=3108754 RepID=UPI002B3DE064|nr:sigma-70 family RNA polymerase sigma factor [Algoriphagus sp. C2-6-M1]MEB2780344.1 sigma-70 family RNA polymerase sigma factor [Algoriphagus sp. C2-6-M1]